MSNAISFGDENCYMLENGINHFTSGSVLYYSALDSFCIIMESVQFVFFPLVCKLQCVKLEASV